MNNIILSPHNSQKISDIEHEITCPNVANHLRNILKLSSNKVKNLHIILPNIGSGVAEFQIAFDNKIRAKIISEITPSSKRLIHLGVATTRPLMAKRIFEHSTTLGTASFNFFKADLSEKSYFDSSVYEEENYRTFIEKGMAQCRQFTTIPAVEKYESLLKLIEKFRKLNIDIFWLDHEANNFFNDNNIDKEILLLIGPERGWTVQEKQIFIDNGIIGIKLSDSVMRVEFAINAAFAQIEYLKMRRSDV